MDRRARRVEANRGERLLVPLPRDRLRREGGRGRGARQRGSRRRRRQGEALAPGIALARGAAAGAVALLARAGIDDAVAANGAPGGERPPLGGAPAGDDRAREHRAGSVEGRLQVHGTRKADTAAPRRLDSRAASGGSELPGHGWADLADGHGRGADDDRLVRGAVAGDERPARDEEAAPGTGRRLLRPHGGGDGQGESGDRDGTARGSHLDVLQRWGVTSRVSAAEVTGLAGSEMRAGPISSRAFGTRQSAWSKETGPGEVAPAGAAGRGILGPRISSAALVSDLAAAADRWRRGDRAQIAVHAPDPDRRYLAGEPG